MKILLVNKFLHPNGGSETYIFEIGKKFLEMGHEVQYFGMDHKDRIVGNNVDSYTANMDFHTGKIQKLLYPFKIIYSMEARKKIRLVLNDFKPDVIHLNNINFQLTPSIIDEINKYRNGSRHSVRVLATAHDYQWICPNHMMNIPSTGKNCDLCVGGSYRNCAKNKCIHNSTVKSILGALEGYFYRMRRIYRYVDCIICPSRFLYEQFSKDPILADKLVVKHNFLIPPVNLCEILEEKKAGYVFYFGRFSKEKGIETLLEACRELPDIPFVFAGKGPLEEKVNAINNIRNVGFVQGEALHRLIRQAAFSIYPSEWYENCPFSVMESQMYGTPVIGAEIGGIPELIVGKKEDLLFTSGNLVELKTKITNLWSDTSKRKEYEDACIQAEYETVEEYCRDLLVLYQEHTEVS